MSFRVLVSDSLAREGLEILAAAPGIELADRAGISRPDLISALRGFDALVVRSRTQVDAEVIVAGTALKVIGRAGIGVDNVDLAAATRAGVVVMNTPEGNATTTAEHAIALMLAMARMVPQASASMRAGKWEKKAFMGRELSGKTLGVIGLGNVGSIVADRAQGLHMKVLGHDPYLAAEAAADLGVELVGLEELLQQADVVTVHTPLNEQTRGLLGDAQIERMKPGVLLINCARGGIYDEAALLRGLDAGKIGAAALDVFTTEPPPPDHPLLRHERVICTPHLGASTREAQVQVAVAVAEQILAFAAGEPPRNAVNLPRTTAAELAAISPYVALAERMGSFAAQLEPGRLESIEVELSGDIATKPFGPVVTAVVAGALRHAFARPVNAVNARLLAQERGVKLLEAHGARPHAIYASLVRVTIRGQESHTVAGTLFEGERGRFVEVDGMHLEAVPEGHLLVIRNRDRPGAIGHIGTVLGNSGINVSRMQLGREEGSDRALAIVGVDQPATPDVLEALVAGEVIAVRQVML